MATNPSTLTIGIAGISSKLCRLIVRILLSAHPRVSIRGLARDLGKVPTDISSHPSVTLVQGDALDASAVQELVRGCSVVLCGYLSPSDEVMVQGQKLLIDACIDDGGVERYFASDWTLDYTRLRLGELVRKDPMILTKQYLEDRIRADGSVRLRGVHVLIAGLTETLFSVYFRLWHAQEETLKVWSNVDEDVWEMTTYRNTAEYTVELILDPNADGVFKFLGEKTSARGIAACMEEVYGIKPRVEQIGTLDELYETMHALMRAGEDLSWIAMLYQYYLTNGQTLLGPIETLDNKRYPNVKPETLRDFFARTPLSDLYDAYSKAGDGP